MLLEIIIGLFAAAILLYQGKDRKAHKQVRNWSNGLIIAALVYVGFALWGANWHWLPIELLGLALYFVPAYLANRFDARWLAMGWALHVAWDVGLHQGGQPGYVPSWYPGVCIGFDIAVAVYILYLWRNSLSTSKQI